MERQKDGGERKKEGGTQTMRVATKIQGEKRNSQTND